MLTILKYIKIYQNICEVNLHNVAVLLMQILLVYKYQMFYASWFSSFDTYIFLYRKG